MKIRAARRRAGKLQTADRAALPNLIEPDDYMKIG